MLVNKLITETGQPVWILDQVFDPVWLQRLHGLCDAAVLGENPWPFADYFEGRPRYIHNETGKQWQELVAYFQSSEFLGKLEELTQAKLNYSTASIWADLHGFGRLGPHKEHGGSYMMQVYITDSPHDWTGTTFYNEAGQVIAQLPYRDNFGWFFHGMQVMHGRHHDVPEGMTRFTLQIWFNE